MGTLTTLYSFDATHGANPYSELTQAANGDLYGTTAVGTSSGTVFRITREGRITTVYRFCLHQKAQCPDGKYPYGAVVEGSDGYFYGTTLLGGANNFGTVFKVNPQGTLTTLYSFDGSDGEPGSTLAEGSDGNFYGTTYNALIFEIVLGGLISYILSTVQPRTEGRALTSHEWKILWATVGGGTSGNCGEGGCGTVYSLDVGLGPFVSLVRYSGRVGSPLGILGQGFTGTTDVSVNGTPQLSRLSQIPI